MATTPARAKSSSLATASAPAPPRRTGTRLLLPAPTRGRRDEVRAPRAHLHAERARDRDHRRAEPAEADEPEGRPAQLRAERVLPAAAADPRVLLRDRAQQREDQPPGELDRVGAA